MPLSPLSESESPLHNNTNEDTFINPFEISDNVSSADPNITIEPDDVGSIGQQTRPYANDTLDEPVSVTILRDLRNVAIKLQQVLNPKGRDLWGPLILCLSLAIILSFNGPTGQDISIFTGVFVIVWCGSAIVTINAKLLGGAV
ncbi:6852_t:CDS:2, partial [Rhizophagus irregularis]